MNATPTIRRAGFWLLGAFLLGLARDPLGRLFDYSSDLWFGIAVYRIVLLFTTCIAVSIGMDRLKASIGLLCALLVLGVLSVSFLISWSFQEVAVILTFGVWGILRDTLKRKLQAWKDYGT